jgi:PIN domain nuclease of toxin-antitoxin system
VKYLLDTHTFIWSDSEPEKLSKTVAKIIADDRNSIFCSVISILEIQIKVQIGKMELLRPIEELIKEQEENNIQLLPVQLPHVLKVGELPLHHKDPFDRLLIAQAMVEGYTLLSKDENFKAYSVSVLW